MKKFKSIIAVVLMMATLLTLVGIPSWADNSTSYALTNAHVYEYMYSDHFLCTAIEFRDRNSDLVSAYLNYNMLYDEDIDCVSQLISNDQTFYCHYNLTVYYNNGANSTTINGYSSAYTLSYIESNCGTNGYEYDKTIDLTQFDNITRVNFTLELTSGTSSSSSKYYTFYKTQTTDQILATTYNSNLS